MDRLYELNAFMAVADAGGFSAAARRIGVSQPSISKAVNGLERRLGVVLLSRSTRRVTVTDQGRRYYERMKPLLDAMEEAEAEATSSTQKVSGFIRISAPATFGRLHVLPLIPGLLSLHPGLEVDLVLSDLVRNNLEDGIDLAIRVGPADEPDAVVRCVAGTEVVCVGSRRYLEQRGIPAAPADLVHHNCLLYGSQRESGTWPFTGPDGRRGVDVRGNLSSNSIETIRAGVLAGLGLGLMTRSALTGELSDSEVMTVLDAYLAVERAVSLVWPKRRFVPARLRRTTEYFATALAERLADRSGRLEKT